jgi:hypothetical protein
MNLFGKTLMKIVGLAVGGAIALAIGAELLSSVVSIVMAFRFGNPMPLMIVVIVTLSMTLISNRVPEETPSRAILRILSYASTGYLAVVGFVIALPYGIVMSIIAAAAVGILSSILNDQKAILSQLRHSIVSQNCIGLPAARSIPIDDSESFRLDSSHAIVLLEPDDREKVVQMMKERPLLAISFTHYEDCDVLFVSDGESSLKGDNIMKLLQEYDIRTRGFASSLLKEAIQLVPVLDSRNGLQFNDYRFTRNSQTIEVLLEQAPVRMTIFPSTHGIGIVIPDMEVPGMEVENIKHGYEIDILLHRDYSVLKEVDRQVESSF